MIEVRREDGELCRYIRQRGERWQVVCIQEASPRRVRVALGNYSLPGVPTRDISVDELRAGEFELRPR
jgi:hypothetical protein